MSQADDLKRSLSQQEKDAIDELGNQAGLMQLLSMSLHGKQAWMTWYMWIMGLAIFGLGLYCLFQFLGTDDIKTALAWMLGIQACISIIVVIKVLAWLQMQKLELMREIKRIELQLLIQNQSG